MKVIKISPMQVLLGPADDAEVLEKKEALVAVETQNHGTEDSVTSGFTQNRLAQVIDLIEESQKRKSIAKEKKNQSVYNRYKTTIDIEDNLNNIGSKLKKIA